MIFQLRLAFRYLAGRKLRTTLTTLAIVFGVMVIFGLNGFLPTFQKAFRDSMMASANKVDLTVTSEARGVFDAGAVNKVRKTDGVAHATGSLVKPVILPPEQAPKNKDNQPIGTLSLNGVDPDSADNVRPLSISKGRGLEAWDANAVIISERLAEDTGLDVGGKLRIPSASGTTEFTVVGIASDRPAAGSEEVFVPLKAAQGVFNQPGKINTIEALFTPGSDGKAVSREVLDGLGEGFKSGGNQVGTEYQASMEMGAFIFNMMGILALAMGGFIIFNTFRTVVAERRRDIGMLRAVGASRRTIIGLFLSESLVQGVIGTALGMATGYLIAIGMIAGTKPRYEELLHIKMSNPSFAVQAYIVAIVLGVGVTVVGGLYPAFIASRVTPLEALRPSVGEVSWKSMSKRLIVGSIIIGFALLGLVSGEVGLASLGAVVFLIGLIVIGPALIRPISAAFGRLLTLAFAREGHLAEGNLARQPERAAITASAMLIGLAILVGVAGMVSSMESGLLKLVDKSMGADYLLVPQSLALGTGNAGAGPELMGKIRNIDGIGRTTTLRMGKTVTDGTDLQVAGVNPETYPKVAGLEFTAGEPSEAYTALGKGRSMIVNGIFASQRGLKVGQTLELKTAEGPRSYKIVGIGSDLVNFKLATGYVSQKNLERDFHETTDLLVMADQKAGADSSAVESGLRKVVRDYPTFKLFSSEEWRKDMMEGVSSTMKIYYGLVFVLAVPSLIALVNTLAINVLERTREIGMMRAVGATRRQVRRIILGESLLLAATGTAFGILAGLWLGYIMVAALGTTGFTMPYYFPYLGILLTIAVGLLFGVLGSLIPARQAAKLNIVNALHYE
ncbi:MAG: ABC transporter permease [Actinobacteria bacterium]|nr:ABC transporter permease [Actinomycetota bacterium]